MKKINVETLVPDTFKFLARDMDGKLFALKTNQVLQPISLVIIGMLKKVNFYRLQTQFFFQKKELPIQELILNWVTGEIL